MRHLPLGSTKPSWMSSRRSVRTGDGGGVEPGEGRSTTQRDAQPGRPVCDGERHASCRQRGTSVVPRRVSGALCSLPRPHLPSRSPLLVLPCSRPPPPSRCCPPPLTLRFPPFPLSQPARSHSLSPRSRALALPTPPPHPPHASPTAIRLCAAPPPCAHNPCTHPSQPAPVATRRRAAATLDRPHNPPHLPRFARTTPSRAHDHHTLSAKPSEHGDRSAGPEGLRIV